MIQQSTGEKKKNAKTWLKENVSRRGFLGAAVAGAAALGFPAIVKAQGPIVYPLAEHLGRPRTSSTSTPSTSPRRSTT